LKSLLEKAVGPGKRRLIASGLPLDDTPCSRSGPYCPCEARMARPSSGRLLHPTGMTTRSGRSPCVQFDFKAPCGEGPPRQCGTTATLRKI
jgi:hypothetical protein